MTESIPKIVHWKENFFIHSYESDFKGNAKISSIIQYFQESAWKHAREYSIGYDDLKNDGKFWVLSSLAIKINEFPVWGDEIELTTWSRGPYKLLAIRDFEIYKQDVLLCQGTSSWIILDINTRRPQRFDSSFEEFPRDKEKISLQDDYLKISLPANMESKMGIKVNYNDLDINRHVNNVKYIEWALNTMPAEFQDNYIINYLKINFLSECVYGDNIMINRSNDRNNFESIFVNAIKEQDNKEVFRLLLKQKRTN